ncbi:Stromal processing peptidase, chloroplastic [Porphyridium purpureum]|uniref:Stromal processing peptidase, chloroplastic n=1 Tax=Porphyridium purpureum TaxID=35688 RepID=A0A5J4YGF5_PORPP|nr:Stromal processing peptidase, chloroplastic [Porphyridium purpureum]|eukprot:POR3881..scf267_23
MEWEWKCAGIAAERGSCTAAWRESARRLAALHGSVRAYSAAGSLSAGLASDAAAAKAGAPVSPAPEIQICTTPLPEQIPDDNDHAASVPLPSYPGLMSGQLPNGLSYVILRNNSPSRRVEAHLEVFSGSADELEHEQGLAHVVEHVSYMGNSARERLLSECAAQTNAYTDFHHTVFYAAMDTEPGHRSLKLALFALKEVLEARVGAARLDKERAAVLSEMGMVNTIEYRTECALLAALHEENRLSVRFPIGLEQCIRQWDVKDVTAYHSRHYCPSNAFLYIVGDLDEAAAQTLVNQIMGGVQRKRTPESAPERSEYDAIVKGTLKQTQSRAFPPVIHSFVGTEEQQHEPRLRVFRHALLHGFSLHVFAKSPIIPTRSLADVRRALVRRIVSAALQIRFNVISRGVMTDSSDSDEESSNGCAFNFVEFVQMDSGREACSVCSLDMISARNMWKEAVFLGITEMRRLGMFGISESELERYKQAVFQDIYQLAAQADRISNAEHVQGLMDAVALQSTYLHPAHLLHATELALTSLTLDEVNTAATEMCRHVMTPEDLELVMHSGSESSSEPSINSDPELELQRSRTEAIREEQLTYMPIVAACVPLTPESGGNGANSGANFDITEEQLMAEFRRAQQEPLASGGDVVVPDALLDAEGKAALLENARRMELELRALLVTAIGRRTDENGVPVPEPTGVDSAPFVHQFALANGLRLNVLPAVGQPGRAHVRLAVPGGRMVEQTQHNGAQVGVVAVGARTLQEGGAFAPWSRQQVELFCVDNLIQVEISASLEFFFVDIGFPSDMLAAALVLLNRILERRVVLESDALARAKQAFEQAAGEVARSLEDSAVEQLLSQLCGADPRLLSIRPPALSKLSRHAVEAAVHGHLRTHASEISLAGDFASVDAILPDIRLYLGSIAASAAPPSFAEHARAIVPIPCAERATSKAQPLHFQELRFGDTDERAAAFIAGECFSWWGSLRDGSSVMYTKERDAETCSDVETRARRSHPLFANAASAILQEVLNRRLFSALRETEQLTYDAKFNILGSDRLLGAYYLAEVTASPEKVSRALQVMMQTLRDVQQGRRKMLADNVSSARRTVLARHSAELDKNAYLCEICMGMLLDCIPNKDASYFAELVSVANEITPDDLLFLLQFVPLPSETSQQSKGTKSGGDQDLRTVSCLAVTTSDAPSAAPGVVLDIVTPMRKGTTALGH